MNYQLYLVLDREEPVVSRAATMQSYELAKGAKIRAERNPDVKAYMVGSLEGGTGFDHPDHPQVL